MQNVVAHKNINSTLNKKLLLLDLVADEKNYKCLKKLQRFADSFQFIFDKSGFLFLDVFPGDFALNPMVNSNSLFVRSICKKNSQKCLKISFVVM